MNASAPAAPIQAFRLRGETLEFIDQRLLPDRVVYRRCDSAAAIAEAIRTMVVRGAPAIGCAAAYGMAIEALRWKDEPRERFLDLLNAASDRLAESRPTAVNLFWALRAMRGMIEAAGPTRPEEIAALLLRKACAIHAEDIANNRAMGAFGAALLDDEARVLTHCNAGALATGGHGTALGVIRSAVEQGKRVSVIAGETRPLLQGARLTAWEMVQERIPVAVVSDNMVGHLMTRGEIDAVIVGADRVAANGDVANKIGTYGVAVLARRHRLPFYVACPLSTIDMDTRSGAEIPIEERGPEEVAGYRSARWVAAGATLRNPAFDVTPADLVSALITEAGVVFEPNEARLSALFEERLPLAVERVNPLQL